MSPWSQIAGGGLNRFNNSVVVIRVQHRKDGSGVVLYVFRRNAVDPANAFARVRKAGTAVRSKLKLVNNAGNLCGNLVQTRVHLLKL